MLTFVNTFLPRRWTWNLLLRDFGIRVEMCNFAADLEKRLMIPEIHIEDYNYPLPDERIAKYPLPERDSSKLLHYENGHVDEHIFRDLPGLLPENALMVFNDTKVVPARMHFQRATGAHIEIFCLEPVQPVEYATAFASTDRCSWKCVIGNAGNP